MNPNEPHSGDDGFTGILGEGRLRKNDARIEALGSLDEATSALGLARSVCRSKGAAHWILQVQRDLYSMMTEVAAGSENKDRFLTISAERVAWLEALTDQLGHSVPAPRDFILPGDTFAAACLDLARTATRRAERRIVDLFHRGDIHNPELLRYLNRLSTFCFLLELAENRDGGKSAPTLARTDQG